MYFSKHNKDITYINHYSGLLEVEGAGVLCREDAELSPRPTENLAEEYDTLSITEGITEVGEGFLDAFPYIDCLILSHTVVNVVVSDATIEWMQNNEVLIRGEYDTFAERFARENSLAFLHSDIPLAEYDLDVYPEHDIVTLRFFTDDQPDIHYNCFTSGSSSGSYGGGEVVNKLPEDFYVGCTLEMFAANCAQQAQEQVLSNETLRRFLEIANERYMAENRRENLEFKSGSGWKACYDRERNLYTAQIDCSDLYEINEDIWNKLTESISDSDARSLIHTDGRHLYMDVNDRCGPPYTVIFDDNYQELCPWADVRYSGKVWDEELTDAAVELFASEEKNREQRRERRKKKDN